MRVPSSTVLPLDRRWYAREETRQRVGVAEATPSERTIGGRCLHAYEQWSPGPVRLAPRCLARGRKPGRSPRGVEPFGAQTQH